MKTGLRVIAVSSIVERDVGANEDGRVADRRGVGIEGRLEAGDVLVGGDPRRLPGHAGLEQQPRLLHVLMALAGRRQAADQAGELAGQELPGGGGDAGPRAARDLDQALLLQDEQRLPDGGAADAEALRQLLLGRHGRAFLEFAGGNGALDMLGDLVGALASAR